VGDEAVSPATAECWLPVISPDGDKVVFECWEGLYVYRLSNQVLFFLDAGSSPRWGQESIYLVYEQTEDDGHVITRADALRIRYDGSEKQNLTANINALVRRPSLSHDGQHLAFDIQGNIFIADIANKKELR
jgi:Tol biopolymer transport system component